MRAQLLLLCGLLSVSAPAAAAMFDDVDRNDPYLEAIEWLADENIVDGYGDGSFRPAQNISRAEFLKILLEATDARTDGNGCFRDVGNEWFAPYVCAARNQGIAQGYQDGTFRPHNPVSLAEAAALTVRAYEGGIMHNANLWYQPYMEKLGDWNAIPFTAGNVHEPIARGEMAYIIWAIEEDRNDRHGDSGDAETFFNYDDDEIEELEDTEDDEDLPDDNIDADDLIAWDHVLMGLAKRRFYDPPMNARAYAALAIAQRDVMLLGDEVGASSMEAIDLVSRDILCYLFPQDCQDLNVDVEPDLYARKVSQLVAGKMIQRLQYDRTDIVLTPPVGPGYWTGTNPVGSYVLNWQYLMIEEDDVNLPAPPAFGSVEDLHEMDKIYDAIDDLTAEELAMAFRWDYSENVTLLFSDVLHDYLEDENADVYRAADVRMVLYTAIADGFTAAWKGKYTYWTARPEQRDPRLNPTLSTPNFPAYPSGHSTLSGASYAVLKYFYPEKEDELHHMAVTNRDARLWSAVHFDVDDREGMELGEDVAEEVIEWYEDQD